MSELPATPALAPASLAPARRLLVPVVICAIALCGAGLALQAWRLPPFSSRVERTDDAYVRGQVTVIAPQVSGYVTDVAVQDFQVVAAGQRLAAIDDRIYRERLRQAQAVLHAAEAALANADQGQASAEGSVDQSGAAIAGAQAQLVKASADAQRAERLRAGGWVAQAQVDVAQAALRAAQAQLGQALAQHRIAGVSVQASLVNRRALAASVENARAQVGLARIDLDNTMITAPRAGRLGEVGVRLGQQVAVGTQLMSLVPDAPWITANFRERQMRRMRVGQPVALRVDALDGRLAGRVERIAPATGSEFSIIRPDNATGNFTKVAQRIPVRIRLDPGQPLARRLSPGMSVIAEVDTTTR